VGLLLGLLLWLAKFSFLDVCSGIHSYSYSIWHGKAVQPTREPEAHGVHSCVALNLLHFKCCGTHACLFSANERIGAPTSQPASLAGL
jgi:hypothetical protein